MTERFELIRAIARLRLNQPWNGDTMQVCAALERFLHADMKMPAQPAASPDVLDLKATTGKFDRVAYQRDYMRAKKAAKALGLTVAEYRLRTAEAQPAAKRGKKK